VLAAAGLVSETDSSSLGTTLPTTGIPHIVVQPTRSASPVGVTITSQVDGMAHIGVRQDESALSEGALYLISNSIRDSTRKSYTSCWNRWRSWCGDNKWDPTDPHEHQFVNYLAFLFEKKLASNTVALHKSAILSQLILLNSKAVKFQDSALIRRVMKGGFNVRPVNRSSSVWDLDQVLQVLRSWGPNSGLSVKRLFQKSVMLLALVSACRVSELAALSRLVVVHSQGWIIPFDRLKKNYSSKRPMFQLEISFFSDPLLCPLQCLTLYMEKTKTLSESPSLFLTLSSPFRRPRPNTLAKHIKQVLQEANIDATAHSCRSASTSKALVKGVSVDQILKRATWANASVFRKFYDKTVLNHQVFSEKVLKL
jgi:integrase